tara:strand:- start:6862 stop:7134 length:273 start_codon:yes stop_codon:yes gene_type:complete
MKVIAKIVSAISISLIISLQGLDGVMTQYLPYGGGRNSFVNGVASRSGTILAILIIATYLASTTSNLCDYRKHFIFTHSLLQFPVIVRTV